MITQTSIPASEWLRVQESVTPFVHPDEGLSYGRLLLVADGHVRRWVGTDAHRMVVFEGAPTRDTFEALLSTRLVSGALSLAPSLEDDLILRLEQLDPSAPITSSVASASGRVSLTAGTGEFPDWPGLAAQARAACSAKVVIDRDLLWRVTSEAGTAPGGVDLDRVCPLFWIDVEPGTLTLRVDWPRVGPSILVPTCHAEGHAHVSVGPRHFCDLLAAGAPGDVELRFPSLTDGPVVVSDPTGWTGYLMPIDTTAEAIRPQVEAILAEAFNLDGLERDADGDYRLPFGTEPLYARLIGGEPHRLQLFAVALDAVEGSERLFAELNEINASIGFARALWVDAQVLFEAELDASELDVELVEKGCARVANLAASLGPMLTMTFGNGS
jgi:hypothetical protein